MVKRLFVHHLTLHALRLNLLLHGGLLTTTATIARAGASGAPENRTHHRDDAARTAEAKGAEKDAELSFEKVGQQAQGGGMPKAVAKGRVHNPGVKSTGDFARC